jgi:hypothetical protein
MEIKPLDLKLSEDIKRMLEMQKYVEKLWETHFSKYVEIISEKKK